MDRLTVINRKLGGKGTYLEIGVGNGREIFWRVAAHRRIGVDPMFIGRKLNRLAKFTPLKVTVGTWRTLLFSEPSDAFFERRRFLDRVRFDCVLVDGLHSADQAYRDVDHALERLAPNGMIVMHDCNPRTEAAALPSLAAARAIPDWDGNWNGDVWRAVLRLRTRPDIDVRVLDCDHGLGIVTLCRPDSTLTHAEAEVSSYAEFSADRTRLLNLIPPS